MYPLAVYFIAQLQHPSVNAGCPGFVYHLSVTSDMACKFFVTELTAQSDLHALFFQGLPQKNKLQLEALRRLADHGRNYHDYRTKLRNTAPPAVPFLGAW